LIHIISGCQNVSVTSSAGAIFLDRFAANLGLKVETSNDSVKNLDYGGLVTEYGYFKLND
jgi:hypothetical protein